jgi:hypothetical protein
LSDITSQLASCKVQVEIIADAAITSRYTALKNAFTVLAGSHKIWDKTSTNRNTENKSSAGHVITRSITSLSHRKIEFINAETDALYFKNQNGSDIYIYPAFAILFDSQHNFGMVSLPELTVSCKPTRFLEEEALPADATILGKTWAKVNKDGSPDKRFKANRQIPIAQYGEIEFRSSNGIFEVFMGSNYANVKGFADAYNEYAVQLRNTTPVQ